MRDNEAAASAAPIPHARGIPPLDSAFRKHKRLKRWIFSTEHRDTKKKYSFPWAALNHKNMAREKVSFLLRQYLGFPDSEHPAGGIVALPVELTMSLPFVLYCLIEKLFVNKAFSVRRWGQG